MKAIRFWILAFLWFTVIFTLSSVSDEDLPQIGISGFDKIAHTLEFLVLGFLLARAIHNSGFNIGPLIIMILSISISVFYGAIDEFHQSFVPGRNPDILDLVYDIIGSFFGSFLYFYIGRRTKYGFDKAL